MCQGATYQFNDTLIQTSGTYIRTYTSSLGTDSVVTLTVIVQTPKIKAIAIHIDDKHTYTWHRVSNNTDIEVSTTGTYDDTIPSLVTGCDSINRLVLTVHQTRESNDTAEICGGKHYTWHGIEYSGAGDYSDTIRSQVFGYIDSIFYNLHLIVHPSYPAHDTTFILCGTDEAIFESGKTYSTAGTFKDTLETKCCGCDSIFKIKIIKFTPNKHIETAMLCKGSTMEWRGQTISAGGVYHDTIKSKNSSLKCDSIQYELHVTTRNPDTTTIERTIWSNQPIWLGRQKLTESGTYYDTLSAVTHGCDSIIELILTVLPVYNVDTVIEKCLGETYQFPDTTIETSGIYTRTFKSQFGTDSTVTLQAFFYAPTVKSTPVHISDQQTYTWHRISNNTDSIISISGTYNDTTQSKVKPYCDSINQVVLTVHPTYEYFDTASVCENKSYTWHGYTYNRADDYTLSFKTQQWNYDSIYHLHLEHLPTYEKDTSFTLCAGGEVIFNGKSYTSGGPDRQTLYTKNGCNCDSIYNIQINEYQPYFRQETMILCKDSTATWHGITIEKNVAKTYYDSLKSKRSGDMCDSVYALNVYIRNPEYTILPVTILSNTYYHFNDTDRYESGTYYDTIQAVNNTCDSIIELRLTVLPVYNVDTTAAICRGEKYPFNGKQLEEGGLYTEKFISRFRTDSIVNLTLTVYEPIIKENNVHISDKQTPYNWIKSDGSTQELFYSGVYDDTIPSFVTGCDSINRLHLFVHETYYFPEEVEICNGKSYTWRGNIYKVEGNYYDSLKTKTYQVDSIYHLHLIVNPTYRHDTIVYICEGDYYDFHGALLSEAGRYKDTMETVCCQCDSVFYVDLRVRPVKTSTLTKYICPGEEFSWRGRTYRNVDEYEDTLRTQDNLCDSIIFHLSLRQKAQFETHVNAQICAGEHYDFNGNDLTQSGDYSVTLQSQNTLCDSIVHLHLKVNKAYDIDRYDTICRGTSIWFDNISRSESGVYVYTGQTKAGCDSIVTMHLTVIEKQNAYIEKHICEGDYIELGDGRRVSTPGTYVETATSQFGCDSTTTWRISVEKPLRDTTYASICKGEKYMFHGVIYQEKGIYPHEGKSIYNCDSTYVLALTINPVYIKDTSLVLCDQDFFTYNGHTYSEGGYYQDTAKTHNGCNCDSILNISITKHPIIHIEEIGEMCSGETFSWRGKELTKAKTYYDTLKMVNGRCDSVIFSLRLAVHNTFYHEERAAICDDNYLSFHGRTYNTSQIIYDSLNNPITGCDSVYCMILTVNPTYHPETTEKRCDIEPYWYNGQWLNQSGNYQRPAVTTCGCDSTHTLHLTVTPTRRDTVKMNMCEGESIEYYGKTITQTGIYLDTINMPGIEQCVINVMDIGVHVPTIISNVIVDDVCADDGRYRMHTYYSGTRPSTYSLVFDDKARAAGFQNVLNEPFDDVIIGTIPMPDGADYIRPDFYSALLTVDNNICAKVTQSHYDVKLLVRYPSWIIEQNWNDVVALLNEYYNGGYRFSAYEWIVNDNPTGNHLSYLYLPSSLGSGDEVSISLIRQGEDYAVPSCPIVIYDKSSEWVSEYPVLAHPTQVRGQLRLVARTDGEYALYSITGQLITRGTYHDGEHRLIQTNMSEGCYLLWLSTPKYGVQTKKIILR